MRKKHIFHTIDIYFSAQSTSLSMHLIHGWILINKVEHYTVKLSNQNTVMTTYRAAVDLLGRLIQNILYGACSVDRTH